jgi:hypothetical protein
MKTYKNFDNLPNGLLNLDVGNIFNDPIDNLPPNLKYLNLGKDFNYPIKKLPSSLTHLILSEFYSYPLDPLFLLDNLSHLFIGHRYKLKSTKLPQKLTHLCIQCKIKYPLELPETLQFLSIDWTYNPVNIKNFPQSLQHLNIYSSNQLINNLPKTIETLGIYDNFEDGDSVTITIPFHVKKIIRDNSKKFIKVPFGCIIEDIHRENIFYF